MVQGELLSAGSQLSRTRSEDMAMDDGVGVAGKTVYVHAETAAASSRSNGLDWRVA